MLSCLTAQTHKQDHIIKSNSTKNQVQCRLLLEEVTGLWMGPRIPALWKMSMPRGQKTESSLKFPTQTAVSCSWFGLIIFNNAGSALSTGFCFYLINSPSPTHPGSCTMMLILEVCKYRDSEQSGESSCTDFCIPGFLEPAARSLKMKCCSSLSSWRPIFFSFSFIGFLDKA